MATCSRILAWEIPWTEEPGGLQSMGLQRAWTKGLTAPPHIKNIIKGPDEQLGEQEHRARPRRV